MGRPVGRVARLVAVAVCAVGGAAGLADEAEEMAARIEAQMQAPDRHRFDAPRDAGRKPFETFRFLGLREGMTAYDALRSAFPAGTVSGAPKIRAMEIITELEPTRRGPYAGAVGFFDLSGNVETCITIRTLVMRDGMAYVQAGGGIVYDSDPVREFEETQHKSRALLAAIDDAEERGVRDSVPGSLGY